jgi:hypothetical protein
MRRSTGSIADPAGDAVGGAVTGGSGFYSGGGCHPLVRRDEMQNLPVGYVTLGHATSW